MSVIKSASSPRPPGKLELADDATLKAHVTAAFDEVDAHKSGKVSRAELRPAFLRLARLAGLPELGGSSELDRAVDEAFETGEGDETGELGKDHFVALSLGLLNVVKIVAAYAGQTAAAHASHMLLPMRGIVSTPLRSLCAPPPRVSILHSSASKRGSAAAPLLLQVFTCGAMRHSPPSAEQRAEAALAEAAFKQMDKGGRGKLSKRDLLPVLATLGIQGSPPQGDAGGAAGEVRGGSGGDGSFVQLVTGMANLLDSGEQPAFAREASIALSACSLRKILASNEPLQKMVSETFADLDVSKAGQLSRADLMSGLRQWLTVWLTPQQVDSLLSHHFPAADVDSSDSVDRGKFSTLFPALLASLIEQLEQTPLVLKASVLKDLPVGGNVRGS
ncbi:unnamed protein product [Closterium sp. NIES-65]|nr:unnamed protein product [Closterium sp. NIES-65]